MYDQLYEALSKNCRIFDINKTTEEVRNLALELEYKNLCGTRLANAYKLNMHKLVREILNVIYFQVKIISKFNYVSFFINFKVSGIQKCNASNTLHESLKSSDSPKFEIDPDFESGFQAKELIEFDNLNQENLQNLKFDGFKTALEISKSTQKTDKYSQDLINSEPHSTKERNTSPHKSEINKFKNENSLPDLSTIECLKNIKFDGFKSALEIIKTQEAERAKERAEKERVEEIERQEKKKERAEKRKHSESEKHKKIFKKSSGKDLKSLNLKRSESLFDCEPRESPKKKLDGFQSALQIVQSGKDEENGEKSKEKSSSKRKTREKGEISKSKISKNYKKDVDVAMHWKISEITKKNLQEHFPSADIPDSDTFKQICRKMVHQLLAKRMSGKINTFF